MDEVAVLTPRGGLRAQWRTITLVVMGVLGVATIVALVFCFTRTAAWTLGCGVGRRRRYVWLHGPNDTKYKYL